MKSFKFITLMGVIVFASVACEANRAYQTVGQLPDNVTSADGYTPPKSSAATDGLPVPSFPKPVTQPAPQTPAVGTGYNLNKQFSGIRLPLVSGGTYDLSDDKSLATVVVFGSSACGPCITEGREMRSIVNSAVLAKMNIVTVLTDDLRGAQSYLSQTGSLNWPVVYNGMSLFSKEGCTGTPCTVVTYANRGRVYGATAAGLTRSLILQLLR